MGRFARACLLDRRCSDSSVAEEQLLHNTHNNNAQQFRTYINNMYLLVEEVLQRIVGVADEQYCSITTVTNYIEVCDIVDTLVKHTCLLKRSWSDSLV
jgi:hypothetical protein